MRQCIHRRPLRPSSPLYRLCTGPCSEISPPPANPRHNCKPRPERLSFPPPNRRPTSDPDTQSGLSLSYPPVSFGQGHFHSIPSGRRHVGGSILAERVRKAYVR
ncbi:hypothetical protein SUGI_0675420 [Cryptomeria japonica]|nr:hypothetical protein SUGI_0675420 [Cryptomeria japonica]